MGKEPSFQYYPKDWRADAVFGCSIAARGLWHEMMNMMHTGERYGYLSINDLPIPDESIARYCGVSLAEYQILLPELERAGVPRRTSDGIIFCKRMVEDAKQRAEWRKQKHNQRVKAIPQSCPKDVRAMSAPSPSPSPPPIPIQKKEKKESPAKSAGLSQDFLAFWDAYPRKLAKQDAIRAWAHSSCGGHLDEILSSLKSWNATEQWKKAEFIPYPATWLNGLRWKENPVAEKGVADERELERIRMARR